MRNFRTLDVWKNGVVLAQKIYEIAQSLPHQEKFGLCSQMMRAAVSIPANIAEGASRRSENDFARFLEIAIGSAFELETHLIIAKEIGYLENQHVDGLLQELGYLQRKANSLLSKIRGRPSQRPITNG